MLEQKKHEAKKLAKEVKKLKRLLDEEKMKAQRSQRFNRIMDHIDSIDWTKDFLRYGQSTLKLQKNAVGSKYIPQGWMGTTCTMK